MQLLRHISKPQHDEEMRKLNIDPIYFDNLYKIYLGVLRNSCGFITITPECERINGLTPKQYEIRKAFIAKQLKERKKSKSKKK